MTADIFRLAVFGDRGSFSEEAAKMYAPAADIIHYPDMDAVLSAVAAGEVDAAILPVMNSKTGIVRPAFEAMGKFFFTPVDNFRLDVRHHLLVRPGTSLTDVTQVVSHPQALAQCGGYLKKTLAGAVQTPWSNTATAAKDLAEGKLPATAAAISSEQAAEIYGLHIAERNIHDDPHNQTTFIILKK